MPFHAHSLSRFRGDLLISLLSKFAAGHPFRWASYRKCDFSGTMQDYFRVAGDSPGTSAPALCGLRRLWFSGGPVLPHQESNGTIAADDQREQNVVRPVMSVLGVQLPVG